MLRELGTSKVISGLAVAPLWLTGIRYQEGEVSGRPLRAFRNFLREAERSIQLYCADPALLMPKDRKVQAIIGGKGAEGLKVQIIIGPDCEQAIMKPCTRFEGVDVFVSPKRRSLSFTVVDGRSVQICPHALDLGEGVVRQYLCRKDSVAASYCKAFDVLLRDATPMQSC